MTVKQVIGLIDSLLPNTVQDPVKVKWLGDLEKIVHLDVHMTHEGTDKWDFTALDADSSLETELSIKAPYDEVYRWHLELKICEVMGEIERLNNAAAKYNAALIAYMDYINRNYIPKGVRNIQIL